MVSVVDSTGDLLLPETSQTTCRDSVAGALATGDYRSTRQFSIPEVSPESVASAADPFALCPGHRSHAALPVQQCPTRAEPACDDRYFRQHGGSG